MENTLEEKARFFMQYWGQTFVHTGEGRPMRNLPKRFVLNYESSDKIQLLLFSSQRAVELTPLEQISDEDALNCIRKRTSIHLMIEIETKNKECFTFSSEYESSKRRRNHSYSLGYGEKFTIEQIDYLRSKGYALPFNGVTVEEQIKRGWVKLNKV